jgi:hypothetical protein
MSTTGQSEAAQSSRKRGSSACLPLIDAATKDLFRKNAFRITGLPVDATPREEARHTDKIKQLAGVGKDPHTQDAAFPIKPPPGLDEIREAIQNLKDPEKRLVDEFFWFWPEVFGQGQSDPAIQALSKGDSKTAIEIWSAKEKSTTDGSVAAHNLALVYHIIALDWENYSVKNEVEAERRQKISNYWKDAFNRWERLSTDERFWEKVTARIRQLNEPNLQPGFARRMRATLPEALGKINAELAVVFAQLGKIEIARFHIRLMRETHQGQDNVEKIAELVLTPARNRLKEQIQRAKQSAQQNPAAAHEAARILIEHAHPLLEVFDLFFGEQEHFQKELFDEVANTAVNCLVAYQRKTSDNEQFVKLLERALPLAESIEVRQRIEENIGIGKGNLDQSKFDPVYAVLKSIQDSKKSPSERLGRFNAEVANVLISAIVGLSRDSDDYKQLWDSAAIVLRGIALDAWNNHQDRQTAFAANELAIKHATSPELKQRLAEDKRTLQQMRYEADLAPIASAPSLSTFNGIGFKLYGSTDKDSATGSYLSTYYFVFLFIPIFPICRYRVTSSGDSYRFFGKAPLRSFDKWHLAISIGLIVLLIILASSDGSASTPSSSSSYTAPPPAPAYTPPAPSAPAYTPPPASDGGSSGGNVYRVPSDVSSALDREKAGIEADRAVLKQLDDQLDSLGRKIESDRIYLDKTSQDDVDAFNAKVDRYNTLSQQDKAATAAFNVRVDNYNAKLRQYGR